jgi:hypothetical protein
MRDVRYHVGLAPEHRSQHISSFRRKVQVLGPSANEPEETFAYGIAAVFCPPQNRKGGYGRHMMRLLHRVLASPDSLPPFPPEWGEPPVPPSGAGNARFSVLWSDIGVVYYETCGPTRDRVGWKVIDPITTIWLTDVNVQHQDEVQWLSEQNCLQLWEQDAQYLKERLIERPPNTSSTRCTFLPNRGLAAFQLRRTNFFLPGLPSVPVPKKWGVIIPGANPPTYATWITDIRPLPVALVLTRIRASPEMFPVLLTAIMEAAKENEAATVEMWNLEQHLLETAHKLGGSTGPRIEHLPALAWYGPEKLGDVQLLFNER